MMLWFGAAGLYSDIVSHQDFNLNMRKFSCYFYACCDDFWTPGPPGTVYHLCRTWFIPCLVDMRSRDDRSNSEDIVRDGGAWEEQVVREYVGRCCKTRKDDKCREKEIAAIYHYISVVLFLWVFVCLSEGYCPCTVCTPYGLHVSHLCLSFSTGCGDLTFGWRWKQIWRRGFAGTYHKRDIYRHAVQQAAQE